MYTRKHERLHFDKPTTVPATIGTVYNNVINQQKASVSLRNISLSGMCFTSDIDVSVGDLLLLELNLFTNVNLIYAEVRWKKSTKDSFTYGIKIVTSDLNYFKYMDSFEQYKNTKVAVV
ncbi:PilZ domain-containing protein [Radiobacillus sp. PE A8.2]|uniref:PilZ domain-containing protein n=1 Tax=Radiobacillus sp. PE A8.2 TaxID=3380349 RepID=UPI00388D9B74